ncbi:hypothetical protein J6590_082328 [Homalodisca vitripennis]|nr:hypothetical protein J6590_082328 [Homalodisca vitripennis]
MGYTCNVCKKSFSRCAFLVHNSDSKCNPAPKEVLPVRPRPSTSTSFEQVEQSLPSTSSNADPSAPTVLQNGSLFMVVHLNNEETRSRPYANLTEVDIRHEESTTTTDNKKSYESNEDNASDFIEDLFDLLPEAAEEQQLQNVDVLFDIAPDLVENVAIVVEQVNPIEVAPTEEHQQMETAESNLEHNNTAALLEETDEAPKGFTKNGNPRKRAAPRCKEDIKSKRKKNKDKHALQPPCNNTCKRKCTTKLTEHRRMKIHEHFWAMEENERKVFILGHIDKSKVKRKTHPEEESRRGKTFFYFLTDSDGARKMIKSKGKMYDFEDFKDAVKASNSGKVTVKSMEHQDFFTEFNYSSQYKIMHKVPRPYLSEMVHVLFQRGSFDMFYRKSFSGEVFQLSFLKAGFTKKREVPKPNTRTSPRGVNKEKKQDIIKKLVPLMPPNSHGFWVDLAVSEEPDLITEHDID